MRASIENPDLIDESLLKQAGAAAVMLQSDAIQIIYGPQASNIKTKLDEYMNNVPEAYDREDEDLSLTSNKEWILHSIVEGEVLPIEQACDDIFANKLMGDGVLIRPKSGLIVSPCDGIISMIYPTKHAIGIRLDENTELLIHFGVDTVKLNGDGFELLVSLHQKVSQGDILWNTDLKYIKEKALDDSIFIVFTKINANAHIEKNYGKRQINDVIMEVRE